MDFTTRLKKIILKQQQRTKKLPTENLAGPETLSFALWGFISKLSHVLSLLLEVYVISLRQSLTRAHLVHTPLLRKLAKLSTLYGYG